MSAAGMNNDKMTKAMAGIGLALPKTMQQRCDPKKRIARLKSGGGKTMTETAIFKGLNWLKATQSEDGSWGAKDKDEEGKPIKADAHHKKAMTGMALLCYLGHCELQDSPDFGPTVQNAIKYITSMPPDESVGAGNRGSYSHPIRTYALCEAYTMTKIKKLEVYAKRAAELVIKGQNENGGWAYAYGKGPAAHTDLSVAGWNIQALKAAAYTGIEISGLDEAMDKAEEAGVDLVEISPTAKPPVCRVMDYGKFLYEKAKEQKEQRKKQKQIQVKEIKFRPGTDEGDYQVKLRNLKRFVEGGDKVKVTLRFRGREMAHQELGLEILNRVKADLAELTVVEFFPRRAEGRQMVMVLAPKK
jgi:translation initiation factor IF-3